MRYMVIKEAEITYWDTATQAAIATGRPKWNTLELALEINELAAGDELDIDSNTSVVALTGKNENSRWYPQITGRKVSLVVMDDVE